VIGRTKACFPLALAGWSVLQRTKGRFQSVLHLAFLLLLSSAGLSIHPAGAALWITGYYPGYHQSYLPPSEIDFTVVTHVVHFSLMPNTDGSLNPSPNGITPPYSTDLVSTAHAAGRKVLICVGGGSSGPGFQGATAPTSLAVFVANLTNFMGAYSYDGIDIDWEPVHTTDFNQYTNFIKSLRSALDAFSPQKLLTVAAAPYPPSGEAATQYAMYAGIQNQFDQINLMTYGLSGAWSGWVTWFNCPLYDGGYVFPSTHKPVPSTDAAISNYLYVGVSPAKLGAGLGFYGRVWSGGAGTSTGGAALPRQTWTTAPTVSAITYYNIVSNYFQPSLYHWDAAAQAAYLSLDNTGSASDKFISYDDAHSCQAKVSYARNRSLGGLMIWELSQGHFATEPPGMRDPLLQAIGQAAATPAFTSIQRSGPGMRLAFTTAPLAAYSVMWTTNLSAGPWSTLANNVTGTGATVEVTDPASVSSQAGRFYSIRTPP
jgi:chitinase